MSAEEVAKYYTMNKEEKNKFWINEHDTTYDNIDGDTDLLMNYYSRLVDLYIHSSKKDQEFLWSFYDWITRFYCDKVKWRKQYDKMVIYKNNLKIRYPNERECYYDYLADKKRY